MAVRITRKDKSAGELRQEAARCRDGKAARRMLAIALVLDGLTARRRQKLRLDRQTLRDWAHRYNAEGVSGLFNRRPPDPPCLLSAAQKEELAEMVRAGPDPETDGVVRWRRIDLKRKIEERFGVTMHERTVGKTIGKPGLSASVGAPAASEIRPGCTGGF